MKKNPLNPARFFVRLVAMLVCLLFISCLNLFQPQKNPYAPIVVITFDDAHPSVFSYAFPTIRSIDSTWGATHFFPASFAAAGGTITIEQAQEMEAGGWETGGHAFSHENLSSVPLDSAEKQIQSDYDFLVRNKLSHESFAYPYGNYNAAVAVVVKKYFKNIRTSHDFEYLDGVNRTELGYYPVKPGMALNDVIGRIEKARHDGSPLVIIGFHALLADTEPPVPMYWCRQSVFYGLLTYLKKEEYSVLTLRNAMDVLCN